MGRIEGVVVEVGEEKMMERVGSIPQTNKIKMVFVFIF